MKVAASIIQEFQQMLNSMDWMYDYSDDHRVYMRGVEKLQRIQSFVAQYDNGGVLKDMYSEACPWI